MPPSVFRDSKRPILCVSPDFLDKLRNGVLVRKGRLYLGKVELVVDDFLPYTNECLEEIHCLAINGDVLETGRFQ